MATRMEGPENMAGRRDPNATPTPEPTLNPTSEARAEATAAAAGGAPYTPTPAPTRRPTQTPVPTHTPAPTRTPVPTHTPAPTRTPTPTSTPRPTQTPRPTATPRATPNPANTRPDPTDRTGPGSRGGRVEVISRKPAGMPPERWARIINAVYADDIRAALDKQARGEALDTSERAALVQADNMMRSEITRWQNGEPFDPAEENPPPQTDNSPEGASIDPSQPDGPPSLGDPTQAPPDATAASDPLQIEDFPGEIAAVGPGVGNRIDENGDIQAPAPGRPGDGGPPTIGPPPDMGRGPDVGPSNVPPHTAATDTRLRPDPTTTAPPPPATRPAAPPPPASAPPPAPASAPPPRDSAPPPPPPPPPPSPWDNVDDPNSPLIAPGDLRSDIEQAGGRASQATAGRVARDVGDVVRGGGYQGMTAGFATMEKQAARAWLQQYHDEPWTLDPAERRAYEADPTSLNSIGDIDSPYRHYRESWIGAYRTGKLVPTSDSFTQALSSYPGSATPTDTSAAEQPPTDQTPPDQPPDLGSPTGSSTGVSTDPVPMPSGGGQSDPPETSNDPWESMPSVGNAETGGGDEVPADEPPSLGPPDGSDQTYDYNDPNSGNTESDNSDSDNNDSGSNGDY